MSAALTTNFTFDFNERRVRKILMFILSSHRIARWFTKKKLLHTTHDRWVSTPLSEYIWVSWCIHMRNMQIGNRTNTLLHPHAHSFSPHTGSNVKKKHGNFLRIIKTLASFFLTTSRRIYFVARLGAIQTCSVIGWCCWQY